MFDKYVIDAKPVNGSTLAENICVSTIRRAARQNQKVFPLMWRSCLSIVASMACLQRGISKSNESLKELDRVSSIGN